MRRLFAVAGVLAAITLFAPTPVHAGGGCHGSGPASGSGTTVALAMNCMTPRVLHAPAGSTMRFVNKDGVTHNLMGDGWGVDELRSGQDFSREFPAGTHVYSCTLHPGMVGAVVVGDGVGTTSVADIEPVRAAATSTNDSDSGSDRLPLGLAIGAVAGVAATLGVRRFRSSSA